MPYYFPVQPMFLNHYHIHSLWVPEFQKPKTSRAPCGAVSHHSAFLHFAELRKVIFERLWQ